MPFALSIIEYLNRKFCLIINTENISQLFCCYLLSEYVVLYFLDSYNGS